MDKNKIEIRDFPVIVVIDSQENNLYETAIKEFAAAHLAKLEKANRTDEPEK